MLKDGVTSPGGTAIAGLHTLEAGGLRNVLNDLILKLLSNVELSSEGAPAEALAALPKDLAELRAERDGGKGAVCPRARLCNRSPAELLHLLQNGRGGANPEVVTKREEWPGVPRCRPRRAGRRARVQMRRLGRGARRDLPGD